MIIELITIGDEVMTGHTVDTNAAWIAEQLTDLGVDLAWRQSIGDNIDAMIAAMTHALKRSDLVLTTGGLGPTDDDLTKRALVKVFQRNLIFHEDVFDDIQARFAKRGIEMPPINHNQALLPQGATFFPNAFGSAVGICLTENNRTLVALPGVPREMKQIVTDSVIPYIQERTKDRAVRVIKLRTTGIVESQLHEIIQPEVTVEPGVKLAYLPNYRGVDLRVIAKGSTRDEATNKAMTLINQLERLVAPYAYGTDLDTLESVVGQLLADNDRTLALAESCTGGLVGERVTSVAGSSAYFLGGVVSYSNEAKSQLLGVRSDLIEQHGAVSQPVAEAMAAGARQRFGATYGLSLTGIAGPGGGSDQKPVGTVWIGIATPQATRAQVYHLGTDREIIRERATSAALELLRREILDIPS